jgi:parvulin-like peptidyl-prolyl isomerase
MVETSTGVQILMFISRNDSDFPYVNVNHILVGVDKETATSEEIDAARAKAEDILEEYQAGEKSQDAFEKLAAEYSEDGNAASGGLYESVYPGQMVAEFEQWCFDSDRKTGDTGVVETEYGFHVMYFAGTAEEKDRTVRLTDAMRADAYDKYVEETLPSYPYEFDSFGMRFST